MDERTKLPGRFQDLGWACLIAAPLIGSMALTAEVPVGRSIASHKQLDSLTFVQYAVDLGRVEAVGVVPAHFDFGNNGEAPLEITELIPSCGCLAPKMYADKMRYEPGEFGRFYVTVKTANEEPGPKLYTVQVNYHDGQPKQQIVTFRLEVPEEKVTVKPSEIYFYQTHGKPDFREIEVTDPRGQEFKVTGVSSESELLTTVVQSKQVDANGTRIPIRVEVPGIVPPGRHVSYLHISTNDPEYTKIAVPVVVFGPDEPEIQQTSGTMESDSISESEQSPATQDQPLSQSSEL